jgi:hypothetical protein
MYQQDAVGYRAAAPDQLPATDTRVRAVSSEDVGTKNRESAPLTTHEGWHADQAKSPPAEPEPDDHTPIELLPLVQTGERVCHAFFRDYSRARFYVAMQQFCNHP